MALAARAGISGEVSAVAPRGRRGCQRPTAAAAVPSSFLKVIL